MASWEKAVLPAMAGLLILVLLVPPISYQQGISQTQQQSIKSNGNLISVNDGGTSQDTIAPSTTFSRTVIDSVSHADMSIQYGDGI